MMTAVSKQICRHREIKLTRLTTVREKMRNLLNGLLSAVASPNKSTPAPQAAALIYLVGWFLLASLTGCQTEQPFTNLPEKGAPKSDVIVLREGDTVRITFTGAPTLNSVQRIRQDGRITLPENKGEFKAAGLTPPALEKELLQLYSPELQTKEVTVAVDASELPIYVTGAVLRPGKISSDRPLTAVEAIMEAGGPDFTKANLKKVRVIRTENGRTEHHILNLKDVLKGDANDQFKLKPADIVYVPERFSWF
jgi:polysaccharide export outer membrane protein